ncbi:MAG: UvrD-helicase domain-containing protein [Clostridia bacterium]|nr:UvrD-helicase domain-containing protein [Clostridia bacterium]
MPEWTRTQRQVIDSDARQLICSAAAGSGKTAVLVERIVRLIQEGEHPSSFLVVTFTNAAAAEMKEKIRKRLRKEEKKPAVRRALEQIDCMEISTIHSFCQRLIRQEFQTVQMDPLFQICDSSVRKKLFEESFREACNQMMKEEEETFSAFRKNYDQLQTRAILDEVYPFIMSMADPEEWLHRAVEQIPEQVSTDHPWFQTVRVIVSEKLYSCAAILRRQYQMFDEYAFVEAYRDIWKADNELFHVKQLWTEGKADTEAVRGGKAAKLPAVRGLNDYELDWKERYRKQRDELKKLFEEIDALILLDRDQVFSEFRSIRQDARTLEKLVLYTASFYDQKKRKRHVADFSDLEHLALKILRNENCRAAVREQYRWLFVDECQDVSAVQDAIIRELTGEQTHLFMVGDVKQSIYRFRLADPMLFLRRIEDAKSSEDPGVSYIALQTNFRSRPEILETANVVFRDVMRKDTAEMDYTREEELLPGRETEGFVPVYIDLIQNEPKEYPKLSAVADHLARQIQDLMDAQAGKPEDQRLEYRDIMILMPAVSQDGGKLADLLKARNIPVYFDGGQEFYQQPEVMAFRLLLELIDNPLQDLPLISALRNAPFFMDEETLSAIRLTAPDAKTPFYTAFEKCCEADTPLGLECRQARERIQDWRFRAGLMHLPDFFWYLMEDSQMYAAVRLEDHGRTAQANLRLFCLQAEKLLKSQHLTLKEYLAYMKDQAEAGDFKAATLLGEKDNLVRIMTMHKSKGLQFPVVFCVGMEHSVLGKNTTQVMTDTQLGLCLRYKESAHRLSRKTVANQIFSWKKEHQEKAEKIRLLYVAMTRAQEELRLIYCGGEKVLWRMPAGPHRVLSAGQYMDWVMPALQDAVQPESSTNNTQPEKPWKIRIFKSNQQEIVENEEVFHSMPEGLDSCIPAPDVDNLWKKQEDEAFGSFYRKQSVSSLLWQAEAALGEEPEETPEEKRMPDRVERAMRRYEMAQYPDFMTEQGIRTGAAHGTAVHRFLSLTDLGRLKACLEQQAAPEKWQQEIREQRDRMLSEGILSREEARQIGPEEVAGLYSSPLGRRLLASPEVHREWNFNLLMEERRMIVQGVMDCVFLENGEWILVDYKTDSVERPEELTERYGAQLAWYRTALARLTGKPVRECWLYSLHLDQAVPCGEAAETGC